MKVIADHREGSSSVIREMYRLDLEVEMQQLDVGDYIVSDRVGIERKTVSDFLSSLIDGRLLGQARDLAESFDRPLMIIEGNGLYVERDIHPNAIRGALACITVDYQLPVLSTNDEKETAGIIASIAGREQDDSRSEIPVRCQRKTLSLPESQRFVVEGLPGVSAVLTKRLLNHFGSVEDVMKASKEDLKEVHGIGEEKAKEIRRILKAEYEEECVE